jgi:hypothetical protein
MLKIVEQILSFNRQSKIYFLALISAAAITACSTVHPNLDLVIAREALSSATEVEGAKYSPSNYNYAEEAFHRGMRYYHDGSYEKAVDEFQTCITYAERAENASRVTRQKQGDEAL